MYVTELRNSKLRGATWGPYYAKNDGLLNQAHRKSRELLLFYVYVND